MVYDTDTHTGSEGHSHEGLRPCILRIKAVCSHCIAVCVIVDIHRYAETSFKVLLEMDFLPGRNVGRIIDDALVHINYRWNTDADFFYTFDKNS